MNIIKMVGSMSKDEFLDFLYAFYSRGADDFSDSVNNDIPVYDRSSCEHLLCSVLNDMGALNLFEEAE